MVLPAPFGTDQRCDHTLAQRHAELVGGHDAPEALRELLDLEGDGGLSPTVNRSVALRAGTRDGGDRGLQVLLLGLGEPLDRLTHCGRPPFGAEHLDAARQRPWPASQAPQRRSFGHQAARSQGDEQHEQHAVDDELDEEGLLRIDADRSGQDRLERAEQERTEHRSEQVGHAADDDHREDGERDREAEQAGRGELQEAGQQRAGESGHGRRDPEDDDLGPEHVLAERQHCPLVLPDPFEHPSIRRLADSPAQEPDDGHGHEEWDEPVDGAFQRPAEQLHLRQVDESVGAAERRGGGEQPDEHRGEREGEEDQVLGGELHRRERHEQAGEAGEDDADEGRGDEVPALVQREVADGVAADRAERRAGHGHLSRVAEQEVQREGEDDVDEGLGYVEEPDVHGAASDRPGPEPGGDAGWFDREGDDVEQQDDEHDQLAPPHFEPDRAPLLDQSDGEPGEEDPDRR